MTEYFPEQKKAFADAVHQLEGRKVAVIGHVRPDGDCIGSIVGLVRVLRGRGIEAVGLLNDAVPSNLKAFVGDTPLFGPDGLDTEGFTAVTVDCADYKRIGAEVCERFPQVFLNIDHHVSNKTYAAHNLIVGSASATAEILAGLFIDLGYAVDAVAAQALYVGIATDTGQFRFPSTTPATFEIACHLCEFGARPADAAHELYERESFARIKLLQRFLSSLRLEMDGRICVGLLEDGVYEECGASVDDAEGLVDYARSIEGVDVGLLLENRGGALKASLRAKDPVYSVEQVAKQFNGGGHACAAGLNVENSSIDAFLPQLLDALKTHVAAVGK